MLVCGVELTSHEAVICLLDYSGGVFTVPDCRVRMYSLSKTADTHAVRDFYTSFKKLMEDYSIDEVVIIERPLKGKFAGSALGFKLETAIQLIDFPVSILNSSTIKEQVKRNRMHADFASLELKKFQQPALNAAYAYHCMSLYGSGE
ncbi:MAG: DUF3010 family protein [Spongiibacteraceae bacterium]